MYGPKGILDDIFLDLFIKEGITNINATAEDINITNGMLVQPNQNPITAINFASPSPIPSLFLIFL